MTSTDSRAVAYLVLALSGTLGLTSVLAFAGFLLLGPPGLLDPGFGVSGALGFDAALCLAFFVQHSAMIRNSFRRRLARVVGERYVAAVFTISAAVSLLVLVGFWQRVPPAILSTPDWASWLLRAIFFASMAGIVWGVLALGGFDTFGLRPIRDHLAGSETPSLPFAVRGPYRWVRHPLYFFTLVMFWAYPNPERDRLLLNGLFTAWVVVGTWLEERDLVATFGEDYREYRRRVPMLVPWRFRLWRGPGRSATTGTR